MRGNTLFLDAQLCHLKVLTNTHQVEMHPKRILFLTHWVQATNPKSRFVKNGVPKYIVGCQGVAQLGGLVQVL